MTKRVGILTIGGDAPGQNACLKSFVFSAIDRGYDVIGIRKGWEGLLNYDLDNPDTHTANVMALTKQRVRDIDRTPGSFLHSSRIVRNAVHKMAVPALITQKTNQIGILKAIGGRSGTMQVYLTEALVYGILALALSIPLGSLVASSISQWFLSLFNIDYTVFEISTMAVV